MAHDTHETNTEEKKSVISFRNSFWMVIILVFVFIAALSFVKAESGSEEGKTEAKTEATAEPATEKAAEPKKGDAEPSAAAPTTDTAQSSTK